jgi:Ser/Thr protein kinase RdoA (MazF antagonist)
MSGQFAERTIRDLTNMARMAVPHYALSDDVQISLLSLSENATFLLEGAAGKAVLRIHRAGYHDAPAIRAELDWIEALRADQVVDTPAVLRNIAGESVTLLRSGSGEPDRHAVLFAHVPGGEPFAGAGLAPWFERLGALTARLHLHAMAWLRPAGFSRHVWDFSAMLGARHLWGPWQAGTGLSAEGKALLHRAATTIETAMSAYGQPPGRFGLIHADLRLANLLVDGPDLRIIDFDDCGFSWFMYDFASSVSFYEHESYIPDLMAAWIKGYCSRRPLAAADLAMLPVFVMARRILLVAWIASHAEVPLAQELGRGYTDRTLDLAERYLATGSPLQMALVR